MTKSLQGSFLKVVYEDEDLLVLDKGSGIPSLPHSAQETETAVGSALAHWPALEGVGNKSLEPGLVHRLDTGTSGLLVFAKTQTEWERLRGLWRNREVQKIYRARVSLLEPLPSLKTLPWVIQSPLAHSAKSSKRMLALPKGQTEFRKSAIRGKPLPALTLVLEARPFIPENPTATKQQAELTIEIKTGVMHQIRCHLASQGWPILGDPIYYSLNKTEPSSRLWLHAWKLSFRRQDGTCLNLVSDRFE